MCKALTHTYHFPATAGLTTPGPLTVTVVATIRAYITAITRKSLRSNDRDRPNQITITGRSQVPKPTAASVSISTSRRILQTAHKYVVKRGTTATQHSITLASR